jgi:hypothetical protein
MHHYVSGIELVGPGVIYLCVSPDPQQVIEAMRAESDYSLALIAPMPFESKDQAQLVLEETSRALAFAAQEVEHWFKVDPLRFGRELLEVCDGLLADPMFWHLSDFMEWRAAK